MILITGGIKSGKSSLALALARRHKGPRHFIATCEPFDEEMARRIRRHKKERGRGFILREEPTDIFKAVKAGRSGVCVIDCVTTWVSNLLYYRKNAESYFSKFLRSLKGNEIIVTNEVGWGVIPAEELSRRYIDLLGRINKQLAARADEVYLMVSGLKVRIK